MKKIIPLKFIASIIITILTTTIFCVSITSSVYAQGTITLKNNTTSQTQTFSTIQQALDFASSHSWNNITVTLGSSTYSGNVTIQDVSQSANENITLQGSGSTHINGNLSIGKYNAVTLSQLFQDSGTVAMGNNSSLNVINSQLKVGGDLKAGHNIFMNAQNSIITVGGSWYTSGTYTFSATTTSLHVSGDFIGDTLNALNFNDSPFTVGGSFKLGATTNFADYARSSSQGMITVGKNIVIGDGSYLHIVNAQVTHETVGESLQLGNNVYLTINNIDIDITNNFATGNNDTLTLKNSNITYGGSFTQGASNTISLDATSSIVKNVTYSNYAGYASVTTSSNPYSDIVGSWIVPAANCLPPSSNPNSQPESAFWIGLGDNANTGGLPGTFLAQIGTESNCLVGVPVYYAVRQMVPFESSRTDIAGPTPNFDKHVNAGDSMFAEVHYMGGTQYELSLADSNPNTHVVNWTYSQVFNGSNDSVARSSALWIIEAPSNTPFIGLHPKAHISPLANFGTVNFFNSLVDNKSINSSSLVSKVQMVSKNGTVKATPSDLTSSGEAFSVIWKHL